jgi:hypothetical protein
MSKLTNSFRRKPIYTKILSADGVILGNNQKPEKLATHLTETIIELLISHKILLTRMTCK